MQDNHVHSNDLSVLIVGKYEHVTTTLITSVIQYFPNAEIIVSTWLGTEFEISKDEVKKIVFCQDPGAVIFDDVERKENNLNRILVLSKEGLKHCSRKYTLRVRSDMQVISNSLLFLKDYLGRRVHNFKLFEKRIYIYPIFSIRKDYKNGIGQYTPYHVSDWCHFGLTKDLKELFDLPLVAEPSFSRYFATESKKIKNDIFYSRLWKMSPEQYITVSNAKKVKAGTTFNTYQDISKSIIKESDLFILNNFVCFSVLDWGIKIQKRQYKNIDMFYEYSSLDYFHKHLLTDNSKIFEDLFYRNDIRKPALYARLKYRINKAIGTYGFSYVFLAMIRKVKFYIHYLLLKG